MRLCIIIFTFLFLIFGCSEKSSKKELTQYQRDSVLSESKIPGSGAVGEALEASDSAKVRANRLDDLSQ